MTEPEDPLHATASKDAFRMLLQAAGQRAASMTGDYSRHSGRVPTHDQEDHQHFTELTEFKAASAALQRGPTVAINFGVSEVWRLTLHFVYACFTQAPPPQVLDGASFDTMWTCFGAELSSPTWTFALVANLRNLRTSSEVISVIDGVRIYSRGSVELRRILGSLIDAVNRDWREGVGGTHVLVVTKDVQKEPTNFLLSGDVAGLYPLMQQALVALRLLRPGDVRVGRIFYIRFARFPFNPGGITSSGFSTWNPGAEYVLDEGIIPAIRDILERLARVELSNWKKLHVALRSFNEIYERYLGQAEDRVLDDVTAIEALVGSKLESSFKVAFRVASILAAADDERVLLFDTVREFYSLRSLIAHGAELKSKDQAKLNDEEALRNIARRLVVAFIYLTDSGLYANAKAFAKALDEDDEVDGRLLHADKRAELRRGMGLVA